ncbi:chemotaxis protein CheB [Microcoleus sp. FACHB-68]|uniref:chemotaxis protein CheB n=1 Tax=Microcoleus sp. FACHB-68 TaxID=2692826 RepID=UPI001682DF4B|nr:chemotaxis protein CheB [Microcoleus sp. FACHB-68]MBD1938593.1 PAS domain-containing protein [Microcoleus sp. FACHB-68]
MNPIESSSQSENQATAAGTADENQQNENQLFPIVGIGASAGGLEAFTALLKALPTDTGMAFVLIQHLAPQHKSLLTEILSKTTQMPVKEVEEGMIVEPNSVYIIPPNTKMAIVRGELKLMPREKIEGKYMPVDAFLQSLSMDRKNKAIGVVLSGMDGDGTLGVEAIKSEGGITFAQCEDTAKYDSMPNNAVASGRVDFILPPKEIALKLGNISRHPYVTQPIPLSANDLLFENPNLLQQIFSLLLASAGVDFTCYKHPTIKRRIMRRMALYQFPTLEDYVAYLQETPDEVTALYKDILINFTCFFRDPESFEVLKNKVFPSIIKDKPLDTPIRIWVPGCSTGEEVYSIAICLQEFLEAEETNIPIQIFATDISDSAIEKARAGIYTDKQVQDVSPASLQQFFIKLNESGYQIKKYIRDKCIFAKQNVSQDPPFSKLDLISCRNMLIYLGPALQKKIIPLFHYALNPIGFLMLGSSETTGEFSDLFALVDKKQKIYSRKFAPTRQNFNFATTTYPVEKLTTNKPIDEEIPKTLDLQKEADRIVLSKYAPAGVVINDEMDILQFRGDISLYLEPAPGTASLNLLKMLRTVFLLAVRTAIHQAKEQNIPIKKEGIQVKNQEQSREVNIEVIPFKPDTSVEVYFLVLFEDVTPISSESKVTKFSWINALKGNQKTDQTAQDREIVRLLQELTATKEYLQSIIAEKEASNEELIIANEEILSSNEEFQSTNEELQTAKEEIQATNEELNTINEELKNRNVEISQVNNDLSNLLNSVNIPILMLGKDLCIRLFTPLAKTVLNIISTDVGRSIGDIQTHINVPHLEKLIREVIDTGTIAELEIQERSGYWYNLRILPYLTRDNKIDGAVLVLVDIDALKHSAQQLQESRDYAEAIVATVRAPLVVLDSQLRVKTVNRSFYETFQVTPEETEQKLIFDLGNGQWNIPRLRQLLEQVLSQDTLIHDFEVTHEFLNIGNKTMLLNACRIPLDGNPMQMMLLGIEDITERKQFEDERNRLFVCEQSARESAETANRAKDEFLSLLSHELRNPLSAILGWSKLLRTRNLDEIQTSRGLEVIERSVQAQNRLIEDMLDITRITTGKLRLNVVPVSLPSVIERAISIVRLSAEAKNIQLESVINFPTLKMVGDPDRLQQIMWNLLSNAIKFSRDGGRIEVKLEKIKDEPADCFYAQIAVSDTGMGIAPEFLPFVFERFRQADNTSVKSSGGLGLGLALVRHLVELHGGTVHAESAGEGLGSTFIVRLPVQNVCELDRTFANYSPQLKLTNDTEAMLDDAPNLEGLHILVVDDEVDTQELLAAILQLCGAEVTAVGSAGAAMSVLMGNSLYGQPAVLVSDISMPEEDGYALMDQVRALEASQGGAIPAVALTANAGVEDRIRVLQSGFQIHISKPVEPAELVFVVAKLAQRI